MVKYMKTRIYDKYVNLSTSNFNENIVNPI